MDDSADSLEKVAADVRVCVKCPLSHSRTNAVPGEGPAAARVMFIGEGPGFHEDRQGRPFVGPSGQYLEELLAGIDMAREQVYITNVVKCFISPRVLIYTAEGYRPIKDIRVGDLVLTHTGKFRKVTYVRPREILPEGSEVVRLVIAPPEGGKPVALTVTPEHPFLINGQWKAACEIQVGDRATALGDRCEVCGRTYCVRYDRYDVRSYHTCGPVCHNKRIMHSAEAREKLRQTMQRQYAEGLRDPVAITARANQRTREMVAAGEAKVQHMTSEERHRGRVVLAQHITEGYGHHPIGYGEEELKTILAQMGLEFIHHFALPDSPYTYDFCLPAERILIEVRGPGFSNQAAQQRALVKNLQAETAGYMVLNLWWLEIVSQPQMVASLLERLLRNHNGEFAYVEAKVIKVEHRRTKRSFPLYNIGVEEDESYVAAGIVSHNCRPPNNRDPQPNEILACRDYLDRQLALLKPDVVVTLGRFSMDRFFPGQSITRIHGRPKRVGDVFYLPLFHPAAALRRPEWRQQMDEDFRRIPELLATLDKERATVDAPGDDDDPEQLSLF